MFDLSFQESFTWLRSFEELWTILIITVCYFLVRFFVNKAIKRHAWKGKISPTRSVYIRKATNFGLGVFFILLIPTILGLTLKGIVFYFASFLTVASVSLFASWSILSNISASFILFFFLPYRIGDKISIMDPEMVLEGEIIDISLFYVRILTASGMTISYPNNLIINKPVKWLD